jgi:hypothetical protein
MLDVTKADFAAYSNAAIAAYFLAEPQLAIDAWEQGQRLQAETRRPIAMVPGDETRMFEPNLEASIAVAYAYLQVGRQADSEAVLTELDSWLVKQIGAQARVRPDLWYVKAQVMSIRGESSLALLHLQRAIDEGWRQHWRPFIEPSFVDLLELETFKSMMAGLAARMQLMGDQLEFDGLFTLVTPVGLATS